MRNSVLIICASSLVSCATTILPPPQLDSPTEVQTFANGYYQIWIKWADNSTDEVGFKVERRQEGRGSGVEVATVDPNTSSYLDHEPPLVPGTEYCYRVIAIGLGADSGYSNESCATTLAVASISCSSDVKDRARSEILNLLTSPEVVEWRTEVGLINAEPTELVLLTDDGLCQQLWDSLATRPPLEGFTATFFQLGDRYIVTEYADPLGIPSVHGGNATAVFDVHFNLLDGVLER